MTNMYFEYERVPGNEETIYINQGEREAVVLAVTKQKFLLEYEMPAGSTALVEVTYGRDGYRSISYKNIPKYWLRAIADAETFGEMKIRPQGWYRIENSRYGQRIHNAKELIGQLREKIRLQILRETNLMEEK